MIAFAVASAMRASYPQAVIEESVTTSGCPLVRVKFGPGDNFNITITRARK